MSCERNGSFVRTCWGTANQARHSDAFAFAFASLRQSHRCVSAFGIGKQMLFLKLTVVPLFIAVVTLAGRRWGAGVAGLLGGFPIVAGPIVVFVALEHGAQFGALAATAAISAVAGLLVFGIAYCWASIRWPWPAALASSECAGFGSGRQSCRPPIPNDHRSHVDAWCYRSSSHLGGSVEWVVGRFSNYRPCPRGFHTPGPGATPGRAHVSRHD